MVRRVIQRFGQHGQIPCTRLGPLMREERESLFALVGSRICHDLISPIGAINNGLELLTMTGVPQSPELELIAQSVGHASARVRFFRVAFGDPGAQMMARQDICDIVEGMSRNARVSVRWDIDGGEARDTVQLAFLAILCAEQALPYGGEIVVSRDGVSVLVTARSPRVLWNAPLWARLQGRAPVGEIAAADVQFHLLPMMALAQGRDVTAQQNDAGVTLRLRDPA